MSELIARTRNIAEIKTYTYGYDDNEDVSTATWARFKNGTIIEYVNTRYADSAWVKTTTGSTPLTQAARMYGRTIYRAHASAPQRLVWWLRWKIREVFRG